MRIPAPITPSRPNPAEMLFQSLDREIKTFQKTLQHNGKGESIEITAYAGGNPVRVRSLSAHPSGLFVFSGVDADGRMVTVLQQTAQVNLCLTATKADPGKPEVIIGFQQ